ncbi:MAG: hypothetical protein GDA36_13175, partial [Rhodobacteraceae bacterium]|nr:hypothetical protein [Paracoccaceae bacterium]
MHLLLRKAAVRIGEDDVLSRIDAPVDWRLFSPTRKRGVGRSRIGHQGYDLMVRLKCLLIGQWHPKAGARTLNCGWISCCCAVSISFHLCLIRRPIAEAAIIDATLVQSAAPAPAAILTCRKAGPPPTIQACISVPTRKHGRSG